MQTTEKILIIDLEATCWENQPAFQKSNSEIIEISVCLLDTNTGDISKNKGILVKPFSSEISAYCTQLTTITQEMVDYDGITFGEACYQLAEEYNAEEVSWASYGEYDRNMLQRQCKKWSIPYPMSNQHINVKKEFGILNNKSVGMAIALEITNIPLEGIHHRGVDDAKNIAKILWWILNN